MTRYTRGQKTDHEAHLRKLTVGYIYANNKPYPLIRLQGKWLEELGFRVGDRIVIVADEKSIVITKIVSQDSISSST